MISWENLVMYYDLSSILAINLNFAFSSWTLLRTAIILSGCISIILNCIKRDWVFLKKIILYKTSVYIILVYICFKDFPIWMRVRVYTLFWTIFGFFFFFITIFIFLLYILSIFDNYLIFSFNFILSSWIKSF